MSIIDPRHVFRKMKKMKDMLGLDFGSSSVKMALLRDGEVSATWQAAHHGEIIDCLRRGIGELSGRLPETFQLGVTGCDAVIVDAIFSDAMFLEEIPALSEGVKQVVPEAGSVIEIGSQHSRYVTDLQSVPQFAGNQHCAGGTGSFFEDQMSRLGLPIEDYSKLVDRATTVPRISGRCSVFAKTDIVHRQQEGATTPDILLGLCYAVMRNYKATIVRGLPLNPPVVFCGGTTKNSGMARAIKDVFGLRDEELIVPSQACFVAAIGAAIHARGRFSVKLIMDELNTLTLVNVESLPPLRLPRNAYPEEPIATGVVPANGCALGIDIGSTSTNLVLVGPDGTLVDYQYLRTAGDSVGAVRKGLRSILRRFGEIPFLAVGITGSGRERVGRMIGADVVRDEITAQAKGARCQIPDADTVFEIGGQDSKYISLNHGEVKDFRMNKICAAGTGSFVEAQAAQLNVPLDEFGWLALRADHPADLGERCTVFIETSIVAATAQGRSRSDIAAGLCYSIIKNYLHKVVGNQPVGERIALQGGVCYNPGIIAAFRAFYGERLRVNPLFPISGAYGVAVLAAQSVGDAPSTFVGYDFDERDAQTDSPGDQIKRNMDFYNEADRLLLDGYTAQIEPNKKTVGVPYVLMIHKFFPLARAFFKALGFNVVLTPPTNEETIRLSQECALGETCYPVKLIYGHMRQLIDLAVDYVFLPTIHTMAHETSRLEHNYGCVYMQTAPVSIAGALQFDRHGIELLSPVFDLDFGQAAMATAMIDMGMSLGFPKSRCVKALLSGALAVRRHTAAVEKQGRELLDQLEPDDKVMVLITRTYGICDPVLNMGIPELLLKRGHKVITLSHLPAHDLDIHEEYPNLYWPFGQHILSAAKIVANHPNLYAIHLTNHGCGPDSMLTHLVRKEMGDRPYLQIEVDEHHSPVGVITRIEAFLNSLSQRTAVYAPLDFAVKPTFPGAAQPVGILAQPDPSLPLYLPDMGHYTPYLVEYYRTHGVDARALPAFNSHALRLGRAHTGSKEYLPFVALLGSVLAHREQTDSPAQYLIPQTMGAEADGQYARVIYEITRSFGSDDVRIVAPFLEKLPESGTDFPLLWRALMTGDLLYAAPLDSRARLAPKDIPNEAELAVLAAKIATLPISEKRIACVGTPMCLTGLDEGVLEILEQQGLTISRSPLSEYLWFLWKDNGQPIDQLTELAEWMRTIGSRLDRRDPYAPDLNRLTRNADRFLPRFAGGNGRYRYAKALQMGESTDAVLTLDPRYENTSIILEMRELAKHCPSPLYSLSLDHDWTAGDWSKLRSFLYYCQVPGKTYL